MSNYTKSTNFTAKDSLITGNPSKLVKGTEIDTELNLISAAIATKEDTSSLTTKLALKADLASPTFTGSPAAPTPTTGDSSTLLATTAFVGATAMTAALPSQTGNASKLVQTDGTNASWNELLKMGVLRFADSSDTTKRVAFNLASITTGQTRTITFPNEDVSISTPAIKLLATLTPTAAATVDFLTTFTSTYDNYLILIDGITSSGNEDLMLRFANAGAVDSGSSYTQGGTAATAGSATTQLDISGGAVFAGGKGISTVLTVCNANDASRIKQVCTSSSYQTTVTPQYKGWVSADAYVAANAISGFRLYWSAAGNFGATGKVRVYGYQNA